METLLKWQVETLNDNKELRLLALPELFRASSSAMRRRVSFLEYTPEKEKVTL